MSCWKCAYIAHRQRKHLALLTRGHGGAVSLHICAEHPSTPSRLKGGGTALRVTRQNPRPPKSLAVCDGKIQSKGLRFGEPVHRVRAATRSPTETYGTRAAIESCVTILDVLLVTSLPKRSNNKHHTGATMAAGRVAFGASVCYITEAIAVACSTSRSLTMRYRIALVLALLSPPARRSHPLPCRCPR